MSKHNVSSYGLLLNAAIDRRGTASASFMFIRGKRWEVIARVRKIDR